MPILSITEFQTTPSDPGSPMHTLNAAKLPFLFSQVVEFEDQSANSMSFSDDTRYIRVIANADCCINVGSNPTATGQHMRLAAGAAEYFGVNPGDRLAVIVAEV